MRTATPTSMETKLDKMRKQLSLGNLRRRIGSNKSNGLDVCLGGSSEDEDHLLENSEPPPTQEHNNGHHQPLIKAKSLATDYASQDDENEEVSKKKLPSSMIVLTETEKRQLEDVLMRIGLKECGL